MKARISALKSTWVTMPFGAVRLELKDGLLVGTTLSPKTPPTSDISNDRIFQPYIRMLNAYVSRGKPLLLKERLTEGTDFQRRVWQQLLLIPAGDTMSYGDIAANLGSGARAVANACRQNRLPLFVPCHRVVASSGIGGFMGKTSGGPLKIKRWLLAHETSINVN